MDAVLVEVGWARVEIATEFDVDFARVLDGEFEFVNFVVDKHTMYFDKVPFEVFWNSFVEARPEIKKELASMYALDMKQELESVLRDEYEDNYEQYLPELISAPTTVTTA